jgi:hypothetical protein
MIVWKVIDDGCPICAKMGEFDAELITSMGYDNFTLKLEDAAAVVEFAEYIKANLMDSDGTVDIPMYIVEADGEFVGAVVGQNTKGELKRKLLMVSP